LHISIIADKKAAIAGGLFLMLVEGD